MYYTLPPEEAVKCAYFQHEMGNWNTWEYAGVHVPVQKGRKTVSCGDFTALKGGRE